MNARRAGAACALVAAALAGSAPASAAHPAPAPQVDVSAGEAIYLRGIATDGRPIEALRTANGLRASGAEVACVNCHRRSGLGATEGRIAVPPITGRYLYHQRSKSHDQPDLPYVEGMHKNHPAYDDATLARAIRDGLNSEGRPLGYLMPHFALGDADMAALIEYLKSLDPQRVPGVSDAVLHFATIVTPDADPVKKQGMLDVMQQYFLEKNTRMLQKSPQMHTSGDTMYAKTMLMVNRRWQLHVWELTGPAATWQAQLEQDLAREPVFAVLSGLGGSNWSPVHAFCEHSRVPCIFPNVEVPATADGDFYTLYLSKGVLLEAELLARSLQDPALVPLPIRAVRQVYRAGDSGEAAARALEDALRGKGVPARSVALPAGRPGSGIAAALKDLAKDEALVLWLRPADLAALDAAGAPAGPVFLSGMMGGLEHAPLPAAWRSRAWLAMPVDLPERRGVRLDFPYGWFRIRHIALVADQVQADTYLTCGLVAETLSHMVDTFVRDYLVERTEENLEHRIMTGYYPRLSLSEGQRFASKGGYVARFADATGAKLVAEHDWVVP